MIDVPDDVVYLLHFDEKLADHAQHYIGFTSNLSERLKRHARGQGAAIVRAAHDEGIKITLVATWTGNRSYERMLKNRKNARRLCPICNGSK